MLEREAGWIGHELLRLPVEETSPLVNLGSSTRQFRTEAQPWIDGRIFEPYRARGGRVIHVDAKSDDGVDIVGDLLDPATQDKIAAQRPKAVLASNLLEHVRDPAALAHAMSRMVPAGGIIIVSGPKVYPEHADPIDTMFRPEPHEAAALFPGTELVSSRVIDGGNWRDWNPRERGMSLSRMGARLMFPGYRPRRWWRLARTLPYVWVHIQAFGIVLRRVEAGEG